MQVITDNAKYWNELENSLRMNHSSMDSAQNPVLKGIREGIFDVEALQFILSQYSLLPANIVDFLLSGANQLAVWPKVKSELKRNVAEERGSRTEDISHYGILQSALYDELGLDIAKIKPVKSTEYFLFLIREGLSSPSPGFVAGVVYGLEDSAIPELKIVAQIINECSKRMGHHDHLIDLAPLSECSITSWQPEKSRKYSLNNFFAMHLFDFEVEHQSRLYEALQPYIISISERQDLKDGFEYTLTAMDNWWTSLASAGKDDLELGVDSKPEHHCPSVSTPIEECQLG
jgi:hypothetical protein